MVLRNGCNQRNQASIPTLSSSNIVQHVTHRSVNLSSDLRATVQLRTSFHAFQILDNSRRLSYVGQFVNKHSFVSLIIFEFEIWTKIEKYFGDGKNTEGRIGIRDRHSRDREIPS